ncbi:MAG: nitroreductase family protein [Negativicutes bacterium]
MMEKKASELEFIYRRRSVRKFADKPVPDEVVQLLIDAAIHAPSGKNMQNWHFVVVRNKSMIQQMAILVEKKHELLLPFIPDAEKQKAFKASVGYHTVFRNAPAVVLVYAGAYPVPADDLVAGPGLTQKEIDTMRQIKPGIQNVAAALQNLHLAAAALGYGTCWMTGPTYAGEEISRLVGFEMDGYVLTALTPLGIPAAGGTSPARKPVTEVLTVVD